MAGHHLPIGANLHRVSFVLPRDELEVHYVRREPERGDRVRSQSGAFLIVTKVDVDEGGVVATCTTPLEYARHARREARRLRADTQTMRVAATESRRQSSRALSEQVSSFIAATRKRLAP